MADDGTVGVGPKGAVLMSKAGKGLGVQRAKTAPQHKAVPDDAVSVAGAAVTGDAPAVSGATMTTAGRGLLARTGHKASPAR